MSAKQAQDNGSATAQAQNNVAADATLASAQATAEAQSLWPMIAKTAEGKACEPQFTVGWSYGVYLRKNRMPPSEVAATTWKAMAKAANKAHVHRMSELADAGFKTTCKRAAVWNKKAKGYDTALTSRVIEPDCQDKELIAAAYAKDQARLAKDLAERRAAAEEAGVDFKAE